MKALLQKLSTNIVYLLGSQEGRRRRNSDDVLTSADYLAALEIWLNLPPCYARTILEAHILATFNLRREDFYINAIATLKEYVSALGGEIERVKEENDVLTMTNEVLKEELQGVGD